MPIDPAQEIVRRNYPLMASGNIMQGIVAMRPTEIAEPLTNSAAADPDNNRGAEPAQVPTGHPNCPPAVIVLVQVLVTVLQPARLVAIVREVAPEFLLVPPEGGLTHGPEVVERNLPLVLPVEVRTKLEIAAFHLAAAVAMPLAAAARTTPERAVRAVVPVWAAAASVAAAVAEVECAAVVVAGAAEGAAAEVAEGDRTNDEPTTYEIKSYYNELNEDFRIRMCHYHRLDLVKSASRGTKTERSSSTAVISKAIQHSERSCG